MSDAELEDGDEMSLSGSDLGSIEDEMETEMGSDEDVSNEEEEEEGDSDEDVHEKRKRKRKEAEAEYETGGRTRWEVEEEEEADEVEVGRLPIKLPTGEVKLVEGTTKLPAQKKKKKPVEVESDDEEEEEEEEEDEEKQAARMAGQKGKFGRMGIAEIVGKKGWKNAQKLDAAKEQIAAIGAEILAGGELLDNVSDLAQGIDCSGYSRIPLCRMEL